MPVRLRSQTTSLGRSGAALANDAAAFTGSFVAPANRAGIVTSDLQAHTSNIQGFVQAGSAVTGSIGVTLSNFTSQIFSSDVEPYDLSGHSIAFPVTWPTAPSTTNSITVSTLADLQTYSALGGYAITIQAGTYAGSVTVADDTSWAMSNTATLTGSVNLANTSRFRWTGGNHVTSGLPESVQLYTTTDVLFDNVNATLNWEGSASNEGHSGRTFTARIAYVNCTLEFPGTTNGWLLHTQHGGGIWTHEDYVIANCRLQSPGPGAAFRYNPMTRFVFVDSLVNDIGGLNTGARISRAEDVYWGNLIHVGYMFTAWRNASNPYFPGWDVTDMTAENIDHYFNLGFIWDGNTVAEGTNVTSNSTLHSSAGAGTGIPSLGFMSDGSGNTRVAWDGSTSSIVYNNMAGKTSASDYGADH